MKKIDLSILNNADDDIIDGLVTFSSDEETKKRVLAMSERKYEELILYRSMALNNTAVLYGEKLSVQQQRLLSLQEPSVQQWL